MSILDNALAHFDAQRAELLSIEVKEWGTNGAPAVIYFRPVATLQEKALVHAAVSEDPVKGLMVLLCYRALDANGKHIFPIAGIDRYMRQLDPDVVADVAAAIERKSARYRADFEEVQKNLPLTPS